MIATENLLTLDNATSSCRHDIPQLQIEKFTKQKCAPLQQGHTVDLETLVLKIFCRNNPIPH